MGLTNNSLKKNQLFFFYEQEKKKKKTYNPIPKLHFVFLDPFVVSITQYRDYR